MFLRPLLAGLFAAASLLAADPRPAGNASGGQTNPEGSITYFTGSGALTLEVDKPEAVYQGVQDLVARSGASVTSYSLNLTPGTSLKTIVVTVVADVSQGESILRQLAQLGTPTTQNYYQNRQVVFPPEVIEAELPRLKVDLKKLTAPARPDFEPLRTLVNKIAETESRLRSARSSSSSYGAAGGAKSTITLQIRSTGFAASRRPAPDGC